jgi:tetratricopeptide (TPR) repeat protein
VVAQTHGPALIVVPPRRRAPAGIAGKKMKKIRWPIAALLLAGTGAVAAQDEVPLADQLEGLEPAPRIAYLRHLIEGGRRDADVFFQLAVAFHEQGTLDSALTYYDRTIQVDPQHFKSFVNKGVLLDDLGNYRSAIQNFTAAVAIRPDDVLANAHLAFLLHEKGEHQEAWRYLSRALEIDPMHPQTRFYLAIFFWDARIYREAMREWEAVIEAEPDGFLAQKARDNIVLLQKALNAPSPEGGWTPQR